MKSAWLLISIVGILFFTFACTNPDTVSINRGQPSGSPAAAAPTATPDEFASARANFAKHCAVCHGENATGGRVEVEGRKLKVPSLKEGHALEHTDAQLVKQVTDGDDEMPAFKEKLKPEEIAELVRFIRKEFQGK